MTTTVTLNPCIDMTVRVDGLQPGELNLVSDARTDVAGKGVNVSVVLRALELPTLCTGISYDGNGHQLEGHLERHGISRRFAVARGNIRTNIKIHDGAAGTVTELNHRGIPVDKLVVEHYLRILRECAEKSKIVVFSGRIPPGVDEGIYRQSIKLLRDLPVRVVVDAAGRPLRESLRQKPYLIKPNLQEMQAAFRCEIRSKEEAVAACRRIIRRGIRLVCLSMGERGALLVGEEEAYYAPALPIPVRGIPGAGDSMVAGLCKGMREQAPLPEMLRYGVAAASASLLREGTQLCRKEDFKRLLPAVRVEKLEINESESAVL